MKQLARKIRKDCLYMFPVRNVEDIDLEMLYFECNEGWNKLIYSALKEISQLDTTNSIRILQIKEKFGTLRIYTNHVTDEIDDVINKYEQLSSVTCEVCGKPGKCGNTGGLIKTLCKECSI